jgi:hypothetical protein
MPRLRYTVFISYSKDAADFVRALATRLEGAGYRAILDSWDLAPGRPYDVQLQRQVKSCSLFIFVISARSILPDAYAITELMWAAASRRRILGVHAPGHSEVTPPPEVAARSLSRSAGDPIANAVSEVCDILGRPYSRVGKIAIAGVALALLVGIVQVVRNARIFQEQPKTEAAASPQPEATRVRVNILSQYPSLLTRFRGKLMGFGLTDADLFNTEWTAETTTQDSALSQDDSKGLFRFYRQEPCYGRRGAVDYKLQNTGGAWVKRNVCDFLVLNDSVHIECPNLQNVLVRAVFALQWNGAQLIGTETVYCGENGGSPKCPATGAYLVDVRLTQLH